jgi:protein involved in polysaccharide export with SLBB domain
MRYFTLLALALAPFLSARPLAAQTAAPNDQTMLSPGDSVRIVVWRKPEFSGDFVMEPLLRVAVSGEVPRALVFAAQPETSIAEAVAHAGGTTQFAERRRIRVIRTEPSGSQRVFYANLQDPEDRLAQSPIRSGDLIVVDRRKSFFKDFFLPAIGVVGSIASLGLLIDRVSRNN